MPSISTGLKPQKIASNFKFRIATLDIETTNWVDIKLIGFYDGIDYYNFKNFQNFLDFIFKNNKRYRGYFIYAHNGGKFDFLPLLEALRARQEKHRLVDINGCIAQISLKHRRLFFRDSLKLMNGSLKNLAKSFNVETQKQDFDFLKTEFNPDNPIHIEYNKADCIALYQVLKKFQSQDYIKDIKLPITTASTAMRVFRTHFLKRPYKRTSDEIQNFCRKSYYGGRVEIFRMSGKNIISYDANSLYPFCMKKTLPIEFLCKSENWKDFGFHDVTIESPKYLHIPVLPLKTDKLIFPIGKFRGVYFSEELKLAVSRGYKIIKHHEGAEFLKDTEFFSDYIDTFYSIRKNNKGTTLDQIAKLLLNSLYGKFGEKEEKKSIDHYDGDMEGFEVWRDIETFEKTGLVILRSNKRSPHALVNIASAITSYGRMHLFETMLEPNENSIYYCDTDSGFIDEKSFQKTGVNLGEWKKEEIIKEANFRLPKAYALKTGNDWKFKIKGFPKSQLKDLTIDQFKNSDIYREYSKPLSLKQSLIQNNTYFSAEIVKKSLKSEYSKRIVEKSGYTRPLQVEGLKVINYPYLKKQIEGEKYVRN